MILRFLYWIVELIEKAWNNNNEKASAFIEKNGREDAHAAVRERARLKRKRKVLLTLRTIFLIIIMIITGFIAFAAFFGSDSGGWKYVWGVFFLFSAVSAFFSLISGNLGNISTIETSDVLDLNIPYALYLRAFEADAKRIRFKEEELVQSLLDNNIVTIAVGLPEEVDASPGAMRVYISNDKWQEEVKLLMERASYLFLRICNTEPCLWELEQALSLPNELYIIIDDVDDYKAVCSKCSLLPKNITLNKYKYSIFCRKADNDWEYIDPYPEDTIRQEEDYQEAYVDGLLEQFPMLQDASIHEYEKNIQGLFSNMMLDFEHDKNLLVAERLLDLMEAYYSKGNGKQSVMTNIQTYLKLFKRFYPLPEELQLRLEDLSNNINT